MPARRRRSGASQFPSPQPMSNTVRTARPSTYSAAPTTNVAWRVSSSADFTRYRGLRYHLSKYRRSYARAALIRLLIDPVLRRLFAKPRRLRRERREQRLDPTFFFHREAQSVRPEQPIDRLRAPLPVLDVTLVDRAQQVRAHLDRL